MKVAERMSPAAIKLKNRICPGTALIMSSQTTEFQHIPVHTYGSKWRASKPAMIFPLELL